MSFTLPGCGLQVQGPLSSLCFQYLFQSLAYGRCSGMFVNEQMWDLFSLTSRKELL